jgi:alginate O-acetyltransferase complex protein AlgI
MIFTEFRFFFFFLLVFGVHWALRSHGLRKSWLLLASYAFYAAWRWEFLGLILASTVIDYTVGRMLARQRPPGGRRAWLVLSLVGNLGLLGVFKYFDFFVESGVELLAALGVETTAERLGFVLPVGISFYTFQTLAYTIDVYRGNLQPIRSFRDFALFVAFFPQLVAGPIVRASHFLPQLLEKKVFANVDFRAHATLFLFGYVKKACVADNFAGVVDHVFADPEAYGPAGRWLALLLYGVQIYCDFSGYSDMAIATAGMLGFELPVNFAFPYLASNVTQFWRRWHISLSTWFRDYLYVPLGGNRRGPARTYLNLVAVFLLCGLWHGASWRFVVWGLVHGFFLVVERASGLKLGGVLGSLYTVLVASLAWVFFRAESFDVAWTYLGGLFGVGATGEAAIDPIWWWVLAGFAVVHVLMSERVIERGLERLPALAYSVLYGVLWALAFPWAAVDYQPFIYFQF